MGAPRGLRSRNDQNRRVVQTQVSQRESIARRGKLIFMSIAFAFSFVGIALLLLAGAGIYYATYAVRSQWRSEEHTSELQSLACLVCRLLLEKKKKSIKV